MTFMSINSGSSSLSYQYIRFQNGRNFPNFVQKFSICFNVQLKYKEGGTCKFLSVALIFASTNPQYDDRLFIELQVNT